MGYWTIPYEHTNANKNNKIIILGTLKVCPIELADEFRGER